MSNNLVSLYDGKNLIHEIIVLYLDFLRISLLDVIILHNNFTVL